MGRIVGYENEKKELQQLRNMLLNAAKYRESGLKIPRGIILHGEPGVGKTQMAKSFAKDGINIIELRAADCCRDDAEDELEKVFSKAKTMQPAVILLDELDKIAGEKEGFYVEENSNINKMLLQELDSISSSEDILVVATCNNITSLGEALLRPGRFDRCLFIDIPDSETRKMILEDYFNLLKLSKSLDYDRLARLTVGYTGAKIECLANETGIYAFENKKDFISMDDVQTVMNRLIYQGSEKNLTEDLESLKMIAVHEAGHAIVALTLAPESIFGASILPQGNSDGHIYFVNKGNGNRSIKDVEDEIVILLAGHVAERICGKYMLGSEIDLERAVKKLLMITTSSGAYGYEGALRVIPAFECDVGERIKNKTLEVMVNKLNEFDKAAENIILENRQLFDEIVKRLIENKTLSQIDLFELKNKYQSNGFEKNESVIEDRPVKDTFARFSKTAWKFLFG